MKFKAPTPIFIVIVLFANFLHAKDIFAPAIQVNEMIITEYEIDQRALFFEHQGSRAVREGDWKLVATRGQPWELYHVSHDRIESRDLVKRHPLRARNLAAKWDQWAEANQVTPLPGNLGADYLPSSPSDK